MSCVSRPLALLLSCVLTVVSAAGVGSRGCHAADLQRARQKIPRDEWKGDSFTAMASVLTARLRTSGHVVRDCAEWSVAELHVLQRRLFQESASELWSVYEDASDNRQQRFQTLEALEAYWSTLDGVASTVHSLADMRRDGLCHEAVMWAVHHVPAATQRQLVAERLALPTLPTQRHRQPEMAHNNSAHKIVHEEYEKQVSCQQCHTGKMSDQEEASAVLPKPLPVDKLHPGRERQRACDYQNVPPCGACEGLGGVRQADDTDEFAPLQCEVLSGPEVPATTRGRYPALAKAHITGGSRFPIEVNPSHTGHYVKMTGNLSLGWKDDVMRMRYDFDIYGSQISAQTFAMAKGEDVGATFGGGDDCECAASIAGNMHIQAFEPDDPFDYVKLNSSQGGATYLGRVKVVLDGDSPLTNGTTAIADHYMKWAFHFLVDADKASPSFGFPLRLYGATGVRQVFDSWVVGDPELSRPDIWTIPANCNVTAPACSVFKKAGQEPIVV